MIIKSFARLAIKIFFLTTFFVLVFSPRLMASNVTAKSCSAADIQWAINTCISTGGGTVNIPPCSGGSNGSTWADGACICFYSPTYEIRIKGAGKDATVIQYASGAKPPSTCSCGGHTTGSPSGCMFQAHGAGFKEWSDLTISGNDVDAKTGGGGMNCGLFVHACEGTGMTNVRIHDAKFRRPSHYSGGLISTCQNPNSTMLIDHVFVGDQYYASGTDYGAYGITIRGPNAEWSEPVSGFGSANAVYIEDSEFDYLYHSIAGFGSNRYVVRHCTFGTHRSSAMESHGPSYGSIGCCETGKGYTPGNACTGWGVDDDCYAGSYRIEVYNNTFKGPTYAILPRSGHWIVTDNTFESITGGAGAYLITTEPSSEGSICDTAHGCPHATGWAGSGSCQKTGEGCWHTLHAVYIWNNTYTNMSKSECTTGNDQNCYGAQGDMQCVRLNTELFFRAPQAGDPELTSYTKYIYPHPLVGGEDNTPPSPPRNLRIISP